MLNSIDERKLAELYPSRRNRYYYGKLMDVLHFKMEQQYVLAKEWLYNRAVLGSGVVCGLDVKQVTTEAGNGLVITSGLAIDGWGREIIVPDDIALVPLTLTDQCGDPQPATDEPLPSQLVVKICYAECLTDFAPAIVNDPECGCGDSCEAGTILETYCLKVLEGTAPPVDEPCIRDVLDGIKAGKLHAVLCSLAETCAPDPDDPCLPLANLTVADDGTLTVDSCTPRPIAPTNRILMQLISCLGECCAGNGHPPPPSLLQVTAVRVLSTENNPKPDDPNLPVIAELAPPNHEITVTGEPVPDVVEVEFDAATPYDRSSAILKDSVLVIEPRAADQLITIMPGNVLRIYRNLKRGFVTTRFVLVGDPNPPTSPHAILATSGTRLDGEFPSSGGPGWHSGDGTEGGNFEFVLKVG